MQQDNEKTYFGEKLQENLRSVLKNGHTFVDVIINATFCKLLSSGTSISEADQTSENLRKQNIPVILGYCA